MFIVQITLQPVPKIKSGEGTPQLIFNFGENFNLEYLVCVKVSGGVNIEEDMTVVIFLH